MSGQTATSLCVLILYPQGIEGDVSVKDLSGVVSIADISTGDVICTGLMGMD